MEMNKTENRVTKAEKIWRIYNWIRFILFIIFILFLVIGLNWALSFISIETK